MNAWLFRIDHVLGVIRKNFKEEILKFEIMHAIFNYLLAYFTEKMTDNSNLAQPVLFKYTIYSFINNWPYINLGGLCFI